MRLTLLITLIAISSITYGQDINEIRWQKTPISIDGKTSDWGSELRYYEQKSRFRYHITNDSTNLYLVFQAKDEQLKMALMHAGFSIKLATHTNPKVKAEILFTLNHPLAVAPHDGGDPLTITAFERTPKDEGPAEQFIAKGFAYCNDTLTMRTQQSIEADKRFDKVQGIVYELKISLLELFGSEYDLLMINQKNIDMEIKINTEGLVMNPPPQGRTQKGGHGDMSANGGGMPDGRMGGHMGGRPEGGHMNQTNGQGSMDFRGSFKHKFKLNKGY